MIPVASDIGAPAVGASFGPQVLRLAGLGRRSGQHDALRWSRVIHPPPGTTGTEALARLGSRVARAVRGALKRRAMPLVLGGDHSVAVGTWSGVAAERRATGPIGLLWIDAHMDAHTEATTPSGMLHGMPLAALLGVGDRRLTRVAIHEPKLRPEHLCLLGVRSYEEGEAALLARLGVRVFTMDEVRWRGIAAAFDEALAIVRRARGGFGVTLDVDAIDPEEAPAVTVPAALGLRAAELAENLARIAAEPALVALEVVEYNPLVDLHGKTAAVVVDLIERMLPMRVRSANVA